MRAASKEKEGPIDVHAWLAFSLSSCLAGCEAVRDARCKARMWPGLYCHTYFTPTLLCCTVLYSAERFVIALPPFVVGSGLTLVICCGEFLRAFCLCILILPMQSCGKSIELLTRCRSAPQPGLRSAVALSQDRELVWSSVDSQCSQPWLHRFPHSPSVLAFL